VKFSQTAINASRTAAVGAEDRIDPIRRPTRCRAGAASNLRHGTKGDHDRNHYFFPVAINTITGFASVDRDMINLMRSLNANGRQIFCKVQLPAALPFIIAGIKNAAAISAIGAIVGEWVGAKDGLGPVMIAANAGFKTATVFAAIFYLAIMAMALFLATGVVERFAMPWYFIGRQRH
jgi:ABC-type proline/glycine betaine transport system permease subunit